MGAMASSFASWFRGTPISNTAAESTNHFAHAYRGASASPVVFKGSAVTATASGGFRPSGSTAANTAVTVETASALGWGGDAQVLVDRIILVGGGVEIGGASAENVARGVSSSGGLRLGGVGPSTAPSPAVSSDSFIYWRRGASVSNSSSSATGGFDHAYRGWLGSPVVIPSVAGAFTATASGGTRFGGASEIGPLSLTVAIGGGIRSSGAATVEAAYQANAGGGLGVSGQAVGGVSTFAPASVGWALGGRSTASLSASFATSGGATFGGSRLLIEVGFNIYVNDGHGGPIDYSVPFDTVYDTTWTSPVLSTPSSTKFGVRAFGPFGLEERNLDASVQLELDAQGDDVTWTPHPPIGVRALPLAGGRARIEWSAVATNPRRKPTGFNIYAQPLALSDYTTPAATIPFATDRAGTFAAEIGPLTDGVTYAIGVRAFNALGEEHNTTSANLVADASPPSSIGSLKASPIARVS